MDTLKTVLASALLLSLIACSPAPDTKQTKSAPSIPTPGAASATNKHPLAKFIEAGGFRITESGPGKLKVTFAVINHSQADIGDLGLKFKLTTTASRPDEAPLAEFEAKISSLSPMENKDVSVTVPTKLRVYELPDWQFLRGQYEITSPAP
jgi:hypothetical protein